MKNLLIAVLLVISTTANAQIVWINNLDLAKKVASESNQFIVMDFWATWYGPCKVMDKDMWSNPIINTVSDKFIAVKIDVDHNRDLAIRYQATSIPKVVVIDPAGNTIWDQVGYSSSQPYMTIFEALPANIASQSTMHRALIENDNMDDWEEIATAYQKLGRDNSSEKLNRGFLDISDRYFKQVIKSSKDEQRAYLANLNMILNDAYRGKSKSALKQLSKLENDNSELTNYIKAYCYMCNGETEEMKKYKRLISNPDLLAQLK
jgi:thiol-disulfide isomerase/thioredoxin